MKRIAQGVVGLLALVASVQAPAVVMLTVESGQLVGARGVEIGGVNYDVSFQDGTCIALFSGCDSVFDFFFQTQADATAASQALLDQVFVDGLEGNFDQDPELTFGCESSEICDTITPHGVDGGGGVAGVFARNLDGGDTVLNISLSSTVNSAGNQFLNYAVWSRSTAVPAPASLLLAVSGLGLIGATRRRHRKTTNL